MHDALVQHKAGPLCTAVIEGHAASGMVSAAAEANPAQTQRLTQNPPANLLLVI
jgi:hypothetical protein